MVSGVSSRVLHHFDSGWAIDGDDPGGSAGRHVATRRTNLKLRLRVGHLCKAAVICGSPSLICQNKSTAARPGVGIEEMTTGCKQAEGTYARHPRTQTLMVARLEVKLTRCQGSRAPALYCLLTHVPCFLHLRRLIKIYSLLCSSRMLQLWPNEVGVLSFGGLLLWWRDTVLFAGESSVGRGNFEATSSRQDTEGAIVANSQLMGHLT